MRTKAKNQEILKYDVFISYKSQYVNIVKAVVHFLEKEKIRCWYAPRDLDSKAAGKDYDDAIVNAINAARIVVVLLCDDALSSDWVKNEIAYAQKKEKTIIPYYCCPLKVSEQRDIHPQCCCNGIADDFSEGKPLS